MAARRTVTLQDIAADAGVSTATASRALATPTKVRADTLARVQLAAKARGYVLHGAGRALRSQRTRTIGTVIPTLGNAIFANATHALQKALEARGYTLLLACHEFDLANEVRVARQLIERGVDGLVLVGLDHDDALFETLDGARMPYVLTWALDRGGRRPSVGFDNRQAAARVVQYLLDIGHREFAMIAGLTGRNDRARERVNGVRAALAARSIPLPAERLLERPYTFAAGREAMRQLASRRGPTAIVCGNDVLAIGALAECRALGIAVPDALSLTGFDDLDFAAHTSPTLTTIRVPCEALGATAADALLAIVEGGDATRCNELPVELVVRETTAPPRPLSRAATPAARKRTPAPRRRART